MPNGNSLDRNIIHILGYFLENSIQVKHRRRECYCLKPNQFGIPKKIIRIKISEEKTLELPAEIPRTDIVQLLIQHRAQKLDPSKAEPMWEEEEEVNVSRKIFSTYFEHLLKLKLITQIKSSDKRSKFYSITPWGICYFSKYADYIPPKLTKKIFKILELFATRNVKSYSSNFFKNKKIDFSDIYKNLDNDDAWDSLGSWAMLSPLAGVLTNFNHNRFLQQIIFLADISSQLRISSEIFFVQIDTTTKTTKIGELEEVAPSLIQDMNTRGGSVLLDLDEDQFHQYLSRFLLCHTIFLLVKNLDEYIAYTVSEHPGIKDAQAYQTLKNLPDNSLKCVSVFSRALLPVTQSVGRKWEGFQKNIDGGWKKPLQDSGYF